MTTYSIRAIKVADCTTAFSRAFHHGLQEEWLPMAFYVWVLRGGGKTIIIDTGFPQGDLLNGLIEFVSSYHPRAGRYENVRSIHEALQETGLQPGEVDLLLLSSLVVYTTGAIEQFPKARIYMSKRGWIDYWIPEFRHPFSRDLFFTPPTLEYLATEAWDRVHLVGEDEEILPGIRMFWAGAHHRSSMCVSIYTSKGVFTLCEPSFLYANIKQDIPVGVVESVEEWHELFNKLKLIGGEILPSHDPALLERYVDGIVA